MVAAIKPDMLAFPDVTNSKLGGPALAKAVEGPEPTEPTDFMQTLREALQDTNSAQTSAQHAADDYASNKQNDLHGTMIAMTEADIKLRLVANVRNKALEAYREVMRMGS